MIGRIFLLAVVVLASAAVAAKETDMEVELQIDPKKYMEYMERENQIGVVARQSQAVSKSTNELWADLDKAYAQDNEEEVKRKVQDLLGQLKLESEYLEDLDGMLKDNLVLVVNLMRSKAKQGKPVPLVLSPEEKETSKDLFNELLEEDQKLYGFYIKRTLQERKSAENWSNLQLKHQGVSVANINTVSGLNRSITLIAIQRNEIYARRMNNEMQKKLLQTIAEEYRRREIFGGDGYENSEKGFESASKFMEGLNQESTFEGNPFN